MKYLSYLLISIVIAFVYSIADKENKVALAVRDEDIFIMRLPKINVWVGVICSVFFMVLFTLMIIFPNDTASIWVGIVFIGFAVMGLMLVIISLKWKIFVHKNHIVYITMFGRAYNYEYSEIKSAIITQNYLIIQTIYKTLKVDIHAIGIEVILMKFHENNIAVTRG